MVLVLVYIVQFCVNFVHIGNLSKHVAIVDYVANLHPPSDMQRPLSTQQRHTQLICYKLTLFITVEVLTSFGPNSSTV